ncbi:S41 family peptidase [Kordiimonas aquimaris]|uniref:S41 family peptidase n=1 Tax=Kordiimonas aquimaris TaxID=707591 RepID=UPI0021CF90B1|nr:S41 family peptidase [Kordiimonas aquimaris]
MRKFIASTVVAFMMVMPNSAHAVNDQDEFYQQLDLLMRIFERVRSEYVDEVDDKEVIEAAIQGMLKSLDPHSTYLNPDVYQQVRVQTQGEYGGLGLEVQMENGVVKVVSPIDDTPADKAGIQGGDFITHIDSKPVVGKTLTEAVKQMRGPVDSTINITVVREGETAPFDVEITREKILVKSVRHRIEDETIGYIRVTTFNMQAGEGVENAINSILDEAGDQLDGVVLDLRNNPGGLLDEAIRISDAFLSRGEIVSTRGRRRQNNSRWYATAGDMLDGIPVVVLVNANSASASEIVAGALQDHRRAVILGDKTFGKGTVQSEIRLGRSGDKAIRLTTARYFTPSGASIQERGIEPDIEVLFPNQRRLKARREADLQNHIINDQENQDRAGEFDPISEEELTEEDPKPAEGEPVVDVQLRHAIKLLKNMSSLPKAQVAELQVTKP